MDLRVVHVDAAREWRGGQTQLLHLVRRAPHAVVVAEDAPLRRSLEAAGVRVVPVRFRGRLWGGLALRRVIADLGADLVAAHDGHGAALALRYLGVPVVVHRRVDFAPSALGFARYRRAAGVIAVSGAVAAVLRRGRVERIRVVHDAVDAGPFLEATPDPGLRAEVGPGPLAVAVGALVDHKGHAVLIRAAARLPDLRVAILGEGPRREGLAALARDLGVADRVQLLGSRGDVPRWLASADVFVHPSVEEGLGQAVIEAGLAGIPIVATTAGGIPEIGVGRLVTPGDPEALAGAIRAALADPRTADRAALADRFSIDRLIAATFDAYAEFAG